MDAGRGQARQGTGKRAGAALAACVVALAATGVAAIAQTNGTRGTLIASPPPRGGAAADAASDNATFSQDNRKVKLMAYDTGASNLVGGDSNGRRDVILFTRSSELQGSLTRVSVGPGGRQANGDSQNASIDGDYKRNPHCVAFESSATNLDPRDRSPDWDVYLRDLRRRKTELISVGNSGARTGVVDGECEFVTYEAGGRIFVRDLEHDKTYPIARGTDPDQQTNGKGVAYERGNQVYYQGYFRKFNKGKSIIKKDGRETLASAGARGAGNGVSANPSMDDNGYYVAFESTATNLCTNLCRGISDDQNGTTSDVYRRTLSGKAPTRDKMQMASFSFAVSEQGNGPSNNPALSGGGEFVVFDSAATNLRPSADIQSADPNGETRDIYLWNFPRERKFGNVSRESRPGPKGEFNGPSVRPAASSRGNYIAFTSAQEGEVGESNGSGIPDIFLRFLGHQ